MLGWSIVFLIISFGAAILGFSGPHIELAKLVFFVSTVMFVITSVIGLLAHFEIHAE